MTKIILTRERKLLQIGEDGSQTPLDKSPQSELKDKPTAGMPACVEVRAAATSLPTKGTVALWGKLLRDGHEEPILVELRVS